jgi:hypothetical protein
MFKISFVDGPRQRRMVVEGTLVPPWTEELSSEFDRARADLQGRELVVDLKGLTTVSVEGKNVLLQIMRTKAKLRYGIYMRELLRQIARDAQQNEREDADSVNDADSKGEGREG